MELLRKKEPKCYQSEYYNYFLSCINGFDTDFNNSVWYSCRYVKVDFYIIDQSELTSIPEVCRINEEPFNVMDEILMMGQETTNTQRMIKDTTYP